MLSSTILTHPSRNEHNVPEYHFDLASSTKLSTHHSGVPSFDSFGLAKTKT